MRRANKLLPAINVLLCAVVLILLLIDAIRPRANLFLNGFVKLFLLLVCALSTACALLRCAHQRRRDRDGRWMR